MGAHKIPRRLLPTVVSDFLDSNIYVLAKDDVGGGKLVPRQTIPEWRTSQVEVIAIDDVAETIKNYGDSDKNPLVDLDGIRIGLPFDKTVLTFKYHFEEDGSDLEEAIFLQRVGLPPQSLVADNPALGVYAECKDCITGVVVDRFAGDFNPSLIVGSFTLGIDDDGYSVKLTDKATWELGSYFLCILAELGGGHSNPGADLSFAARVALATLCLLGCRNISAKQIELGPRPYYESKHRHPQPRFHVLDIEPMKQIIRKESGGEPVTLAKALHVCRGHFKNFDDKPLFGRLKGTYWWQPHVRGTAEAGVVEKDYRIKL